jgi:hypothetical protein
MDAPTLRRQENTVAEHLFANDGTDWTTPPSPVSSKEARAADEKLDKAARDGDGPAASNDVRPQNTIVEGSESSNGGAAGGRGANGA